MKKRQGIFFFDRRAWNGRRMGFLLILAVLMWWSTLAIATQPQTAVQSSTGPDSLTEHAVAVMSFQWWLIAGAFGIIQLLIGFIYINGQSATRKSISAIFDALDHKQDKGQCHDLREACGNFKKKEKE